GPCVRHQHLLTHRGHSTPGGCAGLRKITSHCIGRPSIGVYLKKRRWRADTMYKRLRRWEIAGFLLTGIAGPLLHFTYRWSGENRIVAAFSAVNESTWEHMKLLFVPVFLFPLVEMVVLTGRYRNLLAAKLTATLL